MGNPNNIRSEKRGKELPYNKILFVAIVIISFAMIYIYNVLTPIMSDDLMLDKSLYPTFKEVLAREYWQYMNWTGRSVLQLLLRTTALMPKSFFFLANSIFFTGLSLLIYNNVKGSKKYDVITYLLIQLCLWNFSVDFSQTVLWMSGACNYLWGMVIVLGFLTLFRKMLYGKTEGIQGALLLAALYLLAFLAGWGNENTSGGAILIAGLLVLDHYRKNRKINLKVAGSLVSCMSGFLFLLLAPGNKVRGELVKAEETYQGLAAYISRGLKVLKAIDEYLLLYLMVICLLGVYFYYKKYSCLQFTEAAIFALGGLATAAVLIFTPEPMARAYYGANIYLLIAALKLVQWIPKEELYLTTLKTGGVLAGTLAFLFIYVEEGANLTRILREVNIRESYILEEVGKGESDLVLPMLREEFASKYSMAHLNDISPDEDNWNNEIYRNKYHIDQMEVLPWEEWEKNVDNR